MAMVPFAKKTGFHVVFDLAAGSSSRCVELHGVGLLSEAACVRGKDIPDIAAKIEQEVLLVLNNEGKKRTRNYERKTRRTRNSLQGC